MYANIVTLQYKSPQDADAVLQKIETTILPEIRKLAGFQRFHLVRTGETSTMHIGVFDSAETAESGRKSVYPQLRDAVTPHVASPPDVQHGPVRISA